MELQQQVQQASSETAGKILIGFGGGGISLQVLTEWANIFITFGNAMLLVGGLYLMYHKVFDKRRDRRESDKE